MRRLMVRVCRLMLRILSDGFTPVGKIEGIVQQIDNSGQELVFDVDPYPDKNLSAAKF